MTRFWDGGKQGDKFWVRVNNNDITWLLGYKDRWPRKSWWTLTSVYWVVFWLPPLSQTPRPLGDQVDPAGPAAPPRCYVWHHRPTSTSVHQVTVTWACNITLVTVDWVVVHQHRMTVRSTGTWGIVTMTHSNELV